MSGMARNAGPTYQTYRRLQEGLWNADQCAGGGCGLKIFDAYFVSGTADHVIKVDCAHRTLWKARVNHDRICLHAVLSFHQPVDQHSDFEGA